MKQRTIFCVLMMIVLLKAADEKSEAEEEIDISTMSR